MNRRENPTGLSHRAVVIVGAAAFCCALAVSSVFAQTDGRTFPMFEPFSPPENPPSAERQILGKILFWDEQLSSDNTMSCGTCHIPGHAGNDPRESVNPSFDGIFGTVDDVNGSAGVILTDEDGAYLRSVLFELLPQTTPRRSMPNFMAPFTANLFWDGRAEGLYTDPVTGELLSATGVAATEIQALMPIMNDVEMAHRNRDWPTLLGKLAQVRPLALASEVPSDMLDAIEQFPSYPELFERAFGTPEITAGRIGFALANYQRTLIPNQTAWDIWNAGDDNAMSPEQRAGYDLYRNSGCVQCHSMPMFTSFTFTVDGVRPVHEDFGRSIVTNTEQERGAFKMGTIRNAGIRDRFMHTGGIRTLDDVFDFYAYRGEHQPFPENLDFRIRTPIVFSPGDEEIVKQFIVSALTDPRVANEEYPFDRPKLYSENTTPNPLVIEAGSVGTGGHVPRIIAVVPPNIGNDGFKVGVDYGLGGAQGWVAVSQSPPSKGLVSADTLLGPVTLSGMGSGEGYATMFYPLVDTAMEGQTFYMQWLIADPNAPGGFARSDIAQVTPFCSMIASCNAGCPGDLDENGVLDFFDVGAFVNAYNASDPLADFDHNGVFDFLDVSVFLNAFAAGCP